MGKANISIGVDDATGQPETAPEGPYITDEDDGSRPRRRKRAERPTGTDEADARPSHGDSVTPKDLASRRKGPAQP